MAVTHMHADHNGMSGAFVNRGVTFWAGEGENSDMLKTQLNLDTALYKFFKHGEKTFDLGGGVSLRPFRSEGIPTAVRCIS